MTIENTPADTAAETPAQSAAAAAAPNQDAAATPAPTPTPEPRPAPSVEVQAVEDAKTVLDELDAAEKAPASPATEKPADPTPETKTEEPKTPTASQARRQKQREARERDQAKIAEQTARIAELEADKAAYEARIVDADNAANYDEATQTNAVNKALSAQKSAEIERAKTEQATAAAQAAAQAREDFASRGKELGGITDFEAVVFADDVPFTQDTADAVMDLENGAAIAYDLAANPDKLANLNTMTPMQRAVELGRMSATISAPKAPVKSKAPEPIKPTQDAGGPSSGKPESEMSYAEMRASLGMKVNEPGYKEK